MVLTAARGALAFLTRLPVGGDEAAWDAFRRTPVAFPLAGYVVGGLVALPFLASLVVALPPPTLVAAALATLYLVTGVTHVDGLADVGDAAAAHGRSDRLSVLKDERVGAGGVLLVTLTLAALALGLLGLAGTTSLVAAVLVVAAEVGAKAGLAVAAVRSPVAHEGLGSAVLNAAAGSALWPVGLALLPVCLLAVVGGTGLLAAVVVALAAAVLVVALVARWATRHLGGVSGDALGAGNELARAVALHAGVVAWTLS